jgi:hypothetical protein
MAGVGPAPKAQHARERDTRRRQQGAVTVVADGLVRGPELVGDYRDETRAWYETWRTSAQASIFIDTDWARLQMLAPIVDAYFAKPTAAAMSEIRLNEERFGATHVDRMRARIHVAPVGPVADAGGATVTPIKSARKRGDV